MLHTSSVKIQSIRMKLVAGIFISFWLIAGIRRTQAQLTPQPLNMSVKAFDDQYDNCTEKMLYEIQTLLEKEKKANEEFKKTWDDAEKKWKNDKPSVPSGFRDEYGIAVMAYTNNQSNLFRNFNAAVREYKGRSQFPYHSLHFLLTRAVALLGHQKSTKLYRGMRGILFKAKKGDKVRFGQFSSSSTSQKVAEDFGNDTFFTFKGYFGAPIKTYSYFPSQEEVLIPVDEVFEVNEYTEKNGKSRFELKLNGRCHNYNCDYINRGGKSDICVYSKGTRIFSSLGVVALLLFQVIVFS